MEFVKQRTHQAVDRKNQKPKKTERSSYVKGSHCVAVDIVKQVQTKSTDDRKRSNFPSRGI